MSFEFYCPEGHLLEGDDEQLGTQGRCPLCGTLFMFPKTTLMARQMRSKEQKPAVDRDVEEPKLSEIVAPRLGAAEPEGPRIIKVLCPRNHIVDTLEELLGHDLTCPRCRVRFTPTTERSVTYLTNKHRYETAKAEVQSRFWLAIAIVVGTIAVMAFIVMAVYTRTIDR